MTPRAKPTPGWLKGRPKNATEIYATPCQRFLSEAAARDMNLGSSVSFCLPRQDVPGSNPFLTLGTPGPRSCPLVSRAVPVSTANPVLRGSCLLVKGFHSRLVEGSRTNKRLEGWSSSGVRFLGPLDSVISNQNVPTTGEHLALPWKRSAKKRCLLSDRMKGPQRSSSAVQTAQGEQPKRVLNWGMTVSFRSFRV